VCQIVAIARIRVRHVCLKLELKLPLEGPNLRYPWIRKVAARFVSQSDSLEWRKTKRYSIFKDKDMVWRCLRRRSVLLLFEPVRALRKDGSLQYPKPSMCMSGAMF
jgi:hypothetical protein